LSFSMCLMAFAVPDIGISFMRVISKSGCRFYVRSRAELKTPTSGRNRPEVI
jgi:hypothetical protein